MLKWLPLGKLQFSVIFKPNSIGRLCSSKDSKLPPTSDKVGGKDTYIDTFVTDIMMPKLGCFSFWLMFVVGAAVAIEVQVRIGYRKTSV